MISRTLRTAGLFGAGLASALFAASGQAHECRALGQSNNGEIGQYWLCVGFAIEDGDRPRAGTKNNLDFFPLWVDGPNFEVIEPLDTRTGDKVDIKARLLYVSTNFYEIPHDENFKVTVPWFFFRVPGIGYEMPLTVPKFDRLFTTFVPVDAEDSVSYRAPSDFITPYAGLYSWVVQGTIQRQGHQPVTFYTKWTSLQPRVPFGPLVVDGTKVKDFAQAPEGWYDGVKPSTAAPRALGPKASKFSSPRVSAIMKSLAKR
ncbi:MAG: hypothetical protein L0Y50_07240 [Beijerinckiaceae bacterium]|nr:hypothetical protein [Beijerinckiaceae bacterium]MCI0736051.1 hypothetical protein [Beijerinckiaceae bacterium]